MNLLYCTSNAIHIQLQVKWFWAWYQSQNTIVSNYQCLGAKHPTFSFKDLVPCSFGAQLKESHIQLIQPYSYYVKEIVMIYTRVSFLQHSCYRLLCSQTHLKKIGRCLCSPTSICLIPETKLILKSERQGQIQFTNKKLTFLTADIKLLSLKLPWNMCNKDTFWKISLLMLSYHRPWKSC